MERNAKLALARTATKLLDAQSSKFLMSVSRTDFVSNPQSCAFCTLDYNNTFQLPHSGGIPRRGG